MCTTLTKAKSPTKWKSQKPAYSQVLSKNINKQTVKIQRVIWQTVRRLRWTVCRVETARDVKGRLGIMIRLILRKSNVFSI